MKHLSTSWCFGVATNDGDIMPPFFISHDLRFNTENFIKGLETVVLPGLRKCLLEGPTTGNSILCHAIQAEKSQCWSSKDFCDHIWTLNSSGCNPLYYYMWDTVEQETHKTPCNTNDELKEKKTAAITNFKQGNHGKGLQKIPKSSGGCGRSQCGFFYL